MYIPSESKDYKTKLSKQRTQLRPILSPHCSKYATSHLPMMQIISSDYHSPVNSSPSSYATVQEPESDSESHKKE